MRNRIGQFKWISFIGALAATVTPSAGHDSRTELATTVIYIVRHAEKVSDDQDAELNATGRARATTLGWMLRHSGIENIFATPFKRTRDTAEPLRARLGLTVSAAPTDAKKLAAIILEQHRRQTLLVCGHSNTVPPLLTHLGMKSPEPLLKGFDDLFIVTLVHAADGAVVSRSMQHLKYDIRPVRQIPSAPAP
jgi:phosphohistidine phosphatase SixA